MNQMPGPAQPKTALRRLEGMHAILRFPRTGARWMLLAAAILLLTACGHPNAQRPTAPRTPSAMANALAAPAGSTDDHSQNAPTGPVTTGLGDVDGDGHLDRVIDDPTTGMITVHTAAGASASIAIPYVTRLEGIADLTHEGQGLILIEASAAGCCGYRPVFANVMVFGFLHGHLQAFTTAGGQDPLRYDNGHGDFTGFRCPARGVVTESTGKYPLPGVHTYTWTTTSYRVTAGTFTPTGTHTHTGDAKRLGDATSEVGCPGLQNGGAAA